ncbi:FGGY family carbohydrate kinase [Intrasporangium mesophilum]
MAILAIDQGTSGTKAVVVGDDGPTVLGSASLPIHPRKLPGGGVEQDPRALLESVLETGRRACAQAGVRIDAVALANQGETVLAWDKRTGEPLSEAVVWQDRRAARLCAELASSATLVAARTGLTLDPYFSAPKMAWLRRNVTESGVVTTTDAWLVHHLCGAFVTDAATASRSLVTDLDSGEWDPELLEVFGLGDEQLPAIVGSDDVVGTTNEFGWGDVPVAGLVVDQQAALFAQACFEPSSAKCTLGTGAFLLANTGTVGVRSATGLAASVAWRLRNEITHCLDGQVYTAASAFHWLEEIGLITGPEGLDQLNVEDAGGVLCIPAFAGLGAPYWRPEATATFSGVTLSSRSEHLVLSVMQGLAAQIAEVLDAIGQDLELKSGVLRVDGGLTRSDRLMQTLSDIAQVRVEVYPYADATPLGAAAMARMAMDPHLSSRDAVGEWRANSAYEPMWPADRAADFRDRWNRALRTSVSAEE